jgi:chromosome partitioning protein
MGNCSPSAWLTITRWGMVGFQIAFLPTMVADLIDEVWAEANPDLDLAGIIVNKVPAVSAEAERRVDELATMVGKKAIWKPTIPQRVIVNQALGEQLPIHDYGYRAREVSEAFDALYAKLRRSSRR